MKDGREGFPVAYLSDPPRGVALDVRDDILHVHSSGVSAAAPDGFAPTGDIVEIVEDRACGRASGVVNVGGATVARRWRPFCAVTRTSSRRSSHRSPTR